MFLMSAFGAGAVQISYADAIEEDYNPHAVEDSWTGSGGADKIVRQVRQRLEELLRTKGMQRGSYPTFTVSAKGNKVTIKFRVPPACEISHLIVDIVKHLGVKADHYGGGSEMLLRAWDRFAEAIIRVTYIVSFILIFQFLPVGFKEYIFKSFI
ncbi:hypothetical protein BHE74_00019583 [Ensete ventricosum]|uniref:Uncharacterized protein n=1 Tax=Ensete ventricosum TaxID=4639 RepID=A0A426YJI3_ENSVE|nr:hypothetical protein B296_00050865 [Ensete ventricosum]RWW10849.1 hypothetical protein GW17_00025589 [Ensete ventricosum]RWW72598.1 hypothetical protein BHE74_00019583 [Ensete ventricosum]RZR95094.1 hypothetical protein BHM03_00023903 [Ensete ventricosum]